MVGLNKISGHLSMVSSVHWYGHVLRRAFAFEIEGKGRNGGRRGHGRSRLRKKA